MPARFLLLLAPLFACGSVRVDHEPGDVTGGDPVSQSCAACTGAAACHAETGDCLQSDDNGCSSIELGMRLGTFLVDTREFGDAYDTFDCGTACDDTAPVASTPDVTLSWLVPEADTWYGFRATSDQPILVVKAIPISTANPCGGEPCCYDGSGGPPYAVSNTHWTDTAFTRINFVIEGADGSTGPITFELCETSCD